MEVEFVDTEVESGPREDVEVDRGGCGEVNGGREEDVDNRRT